jgi:hypothetical protein
VSPPTPEQAAEAADAALAALTGTITERKPVTDLDRAMLRLRLVADAKDRGIPWAVIGRALGCSGKEAHKRMKLLAAQTQRTMLLDKAQQAGIPAARRGRARTPRRGAVPKPRTAVAAED